MPAKSAAQYRLMQAASHGGLSGPKEIPTAVARDFVKNTPRKTRSMWSAHRTHSKRK